MKSHSINLAARCLVTEDEHGTEYALLAHALKPEQLKRWRKELLANEELKQAYHQRLEVSSFDADFQLSRMMVKAQEKLATFIDIADPKDPYTVRVLVTLYGQLASVQKAKPEKLRIAPELPPEEAKPVEPTHIEEQADVMDFQAHVKKRTQALEAVVIESAD